MIFQILNNGSIILMRCHSVRSRSVDVLDPLIHIVTGNLGNIFF